MGFTTATHIDWIILAWLNSLAGRSTAFDRTITFLSHGEPVDGAIVMSLFWWYWFRQTGASTVQRTREYLVGTMFAAAGSLFAARILALTLPFRLRPRFEPELHLNWPVAPSSVLVIDWSSFPSDHAVMFSALAVGLWFISWRAGLAALLFAGLVVSFPRVYFGVHYPTDIVVGAAIGGLAAYCVNASAVCRKLAGGVLLWERRAPQAFYVGLFIVTFEFATMFMSVRQVAVDVLRLLGVALGRSAPG
jgi:undecaprenyl-diphosphatase